MVYGSISLLIAGTDESSLLLRQNKQTRWQLLSHPKSSQGRQPDSASVYPRTLATGIRETYFSQFLNPNSY